MRKIRGVRKVAGSLLHALSGGGRKDSGRARSYRWLKPSDDQSGLVTLEWIILIAAVSGIVTLALLAGWNALWNRSDSLSDEGGSGHQLAANRAAAEASSGRACSLLNDLYSYDFKYVPVAAGSTNCTCEIDSEATASEVCDVELVENADITIVLERGGAPRKIDTSQLFFSENSADLSYTVTSLPSVSLASAAYESAPNAEVLNVSPASGGAGVGTTAVVVQASDSNTSSSKTARISIEVEDNSCVVQGSHRPFPGIGLSTTSSPRFYVFLPRDHFRTGFSAITVTPSNPGIVSVLSQNIAIEDPPITVDLAPGQTRSRREERIYTIFSIATGITQLTFDVVYCNTLRPPPLTMDFVVNKDDIVTYLSPQTYSTSPQTIDLTTIFDPTVLSSPTYTVESQDPSVATVSESAGTLTITKVAAGTTSIEVSAMEHGATIDTSFSVTFS